MFSYGTLPRRNHRRHSVQLCSTTTTCCVFTRFGYYGFSHIISDSGENSANANTITITRFYPSSSPSKQSFALTYSKLCIFFVIIPVESFQYRFEIYTAPSVSTILTCVISSYNNHFEYIFLQFFIHDKPFQLPNKPQININAYTRLMRTILP